MYLEGCSWNAAEVTLDESEAKILFVHCPMIWFRPCKTSEFKQY